MNPDGFKLRKLFFFVKQLLERKISDIYPLDLALPDNPALKSDFTFSWTKLKSLAVNDLDSRFNYCNFHPKT
ncbi:MAG: hypothetical protein AAF915_14195 [Cyanobacteria bacterium P01_D01_bin.50]